MPFSVCATSWEDRFSELENFLKDRELGHALTSVKVTLRQSIPRMEFGSVLLEEKKEGEVLEIPRWIAEVLQELGLGEMMEESFEAELFKSLSRERMQESLQLSTLKADFYLRMKKFLEELRAKRKRNLLLKPDYDKLSISAYDLLTLRTSKLLYLASAPSPSTDLVRKITPEEAQLFDYVHKTVEKWRRLVLEGTPE